MTATTTRSDTLVPMDGRTLGHPMDTKNRRWPMDARPATAPVRRRRRRAGIAAVIAAAALAAVPTALGSGGGVLCSPGFEPTQATDTTASFDRDADGMVCVNTATGQVRDDHGSRRTRR